MFGVHVLHGPMEPPPPPQSALSQSVATSVPEFVPCHSCFGNTDLPNDLQPASARHVIAKSFTSAPSRHRCPGHPTWPSEDEPFHGSANCVKEQRHFPNRALDSPGEWTACDATEPVLNCQGSSTTLYGAVHRVNVHAERPPTASTLDFVVKPVDPKLSACCWKTAVMVRAIKKYARKHPLSPPEVEHRRRVANQQERRRMHRLNSALDRLRQMLPPELRSPQHSSASSARRMSKIKTLKMAMFYIDSLNKLLAGTDREEPR